MRYYISSNGGDSSLPLFIVDSEGHVVVARGETVATRYLHELIDNANIGAKLPKVRSDAQVDRTGGA